MGFTGETDERSTFVNHVHNSNLKWGNCLAKAWVEYWSATFFKKYFSSIVTLLKKYFLKKCTCYLYYLSLCLGRKMNMVWARYTNLVKVERLLVNQNRKRFFYYMYHYVLNINVYHIHYVCIILFITDTRNRKYVRYFHCLFFICFTFWS